jgi:zinc/manganese transport system substrate-binding protein
MHVGSNEYKEATKMKKYLVLILFLCLLLVSASYAGAGKLFVVTTISSYGNIAKIVGGDRVQVTSLVAGNQDPHFVRPKLSYSETLAKADLFIDTGLDLELWVPPLEDTAGNKKIMSGGDAYVSISTGIDLLEIPAIADRKEGGVHIYGNPHIYTCPYCLPFMAKNVYTGLAKVDPAGKSQYKKNLDAFEAKIYEKLYGKELVGILGGKVLNKMGAKGKLYDFLQKETYKDKPLLDYAGGWFKQALPMRGKKVVAYHKNWAYFEKFFGIKIMEYVEPKPGIPPTPKHVKHVVDVMKQHNIKVILAANYYDKAKVNSIAKKVDAKPVIVSISAGGQKGVNDVFDVIQQILDNLVPALAGAE